MAGRHVRDDALGTDDCHLRPAPGSAGRDPRLDAVQTFQFTFMVSGLGDTLPEFGLVGNAAIMAEEIGTRQFRQWTTECYGTGKEGKAAGRCDHGKDKVTDAGNG